MVAIVVLAALPADARQRQNLIPSGWKQVFVDKQTKTRRFVSPDGRSTFTTHQAFANTSNLQADIDRVATRDGEQVTYQQRGKSWIATSGFRGGRIFYRKSNLACGGTRWNQVELVYPADAKREMDAPVTRIAHGMTEYAGDCP
jgi:hypothetical protein